MRLMDDVSWNLLGLTRLVSMQLAEHEAPKPTTITDCLGAINMNPRSRKNVGPTPKSAKRRLATEMESVWRDLTISWI